MFFSGVGGDQKWSRNIFACFLREICIGFYCKKRRVVSGLPTYSTLILWFSHNKVSLCFHLHRHIEGFFRGSRETKLFPVREPQWPGEAGQVGGQHGILGWSHLCPAQEHLDPWLRLPGVPCKTRLLPARHAAPPPPAQIPTH